MSRGFIAAALLVALTLSLLPGAAASDVFDGQLSPPQEEAAPAQIDSVEGLLTACKDASLAGRTQLMDALHEYFVSEMECSLKAQLLEDARSAKERLDADALMGLAEQAALDAAEAAVDRAQTESDKAALEQLKLVTRIRGLTGVDIRDLGLNAQDAFLTLQPKDISLQELKDAAEALRAPEEAELAALEMEQGYIDISLSYAQISDAAAEYFAASEQREAVARDLVMGNATAEAFRTATAEVRRARLTLFTAMSDYSRLLYRLNGAAGGLLCGKAAFLSTYLGENA